MERLKLKKTLSITLLSLFVFLAVSCGGSNNSRKNENKSNESTKPSFTCKNCGGHSYKNHETVPDMKVCQSCGIGN